ncbi:MAG: hypothetical protein HN909_08835 [Phycisphaerales bacterium]|jgi:hypothetical protein|nr:hypothetical protein [Phycisphaerales bacterium]MBT7171856.1 hypothetical protein [Phycisphaerales bacterium]
MTLEYSIDVEKKIVLSIGSDTLTDADVLSHRNRLARDPLLDPTQYNHLVDLTQVERLELSQETIQSIVRNNPWGKGSRRAMVASSKVIFGISRMIQLSLEDQGDETHVFDNLEEAKVWLGLK